jgi:hypothetical protein
MPSVPSRQAKAAQPGKLAAGQAKAAQHGRPRRRRRNRELLGVDDLRGAAKMHNGVLPAAIRARPWSTSIGGGHGLRIQARRRKMATGSWRQRPGVRSLMGAEIH